MIHFEQYLKDFENNLEFDIPKLICNYSFFLKLKKLISNEELLKQIIVNYDDLIKYNNDKI